MSSAAGHRNKNFTVLLQLTQQIAVQTDSIAKGRVRGISPLLHVRVSVSSDLPSPLPPRHRNCIWPLFPGHGLGKAPRRDLSPVCCQQSRRQHLGGSSPSESSLTPPSPQGLWSGRCATFSANANPNYSASGYSSKGSGPASGGRFLGGPPRNSGNVTTSVGSAERALRNEDKAEQKGEIKEQISFPTAAGL